MDRSVHDQSQPTANRPTRSLARQFIGDYLLISAVPIGLLLLIMFGFALFFANYSAQLVQGITRDLSGQAEQSLRQLGERAIEAQARNVAHQLAIYLQAHPEATIEQLQLSQDFKELAVQPVGETGYTAVFDSNGITHFHVNPKIVGMDMHQLADTLPKFWAIFEAGLDGTVSPGYYEWQEADGSRRDKFMVTVPVGNTNLRVAATTYIDEFSRPVISMQEQANLILERYQVFVSQLWWVLGVGSLVGLTLVVGGVYMLARRATSRYITPIVELAAAIEQLEATQTFSPPAAVLNRPDEIGALASNLTDLIEQRRQSLTELEQRSQALALSAEVSQRVSTILNQEQLLSQVVEQIRTTFNYYHVHIYLLDKTGQNLVVTAGTGQAGQEMKAAGYQIPIDTSASLVARAARAGEVVRVDNVLADEGWLPNPLLPDTCSEMAVPIVLAGQVVGVLDVQQDKIAGLDEGDADLLRSLANQVAVAIRNARLFEEVEAALAEARAAQARYLEQSWQQVRGRQVGGQYHYARAEAAPLSESAVAMGRQEALAHNNLALVPLEANGSAAPAIVAPIKVADQPIGALQLYPLQADQSWNEDDLAVVEAVIDELGQAAENLRLFEETRERAGREQAIREITDKLRPAPNLERLVKIAAEELGQRLSASHAQLELGLERDRPVGRMQVGQHG